jgi:hypothetical protein
LRTGRETRLAGGGTALTRVAAFMGVVVRFRIAGQCDRLPSCTIWPFHALRQYRRPPTKPDFNVEHRYELLKIFS